MTALLFGVCLVLAFSLWAAVLRLRDVEGQLERAIDENTKLAKSLWGEQ